MNGDGGMLLFTCLHTVLVMNVVPVDQVSAISVGVLALTHICTISNGECGDVCVCMNANI